MKKIIVGLILSALVMCGLTAQTVHYVEEATITWHAVTELESGTPIDPGDIIEYELYRTPSPVIDRENPSAHILEGTVSVPSLHVYIPNDGVLYFYGVRTKRTTDGGATVLYSTFNWSDVNGLSTPDPFAYKHPATERPKAPTGLAMN